MSARRLAVAAAGAAALVFLYFWNPSDIQAFPKCPFLALTGFKCPGCGTLRATHALLHFRLADAARLNLLLVVFIPVLACMCISRKFRSHVMLGRVLLTLIIAWWIARNVFGKLSCA